MLTKEKQSIRATLSLRVVEAKVASEYGLFQAQPNGAEETGEWCGRLFEFVEYAPAPFAERFPRLMFSVVAVALLLATITTEIECLRASGYFWQ